MVKQEQIGGSLPGSIYKFNIRSKGDRLLQNNVWNNNHNTHMNGHKFLVLYSLSVCVFLDLSPGLLF